MKILQFFFMNSGEVVFLLYYIVFAILFFDGLYLIKTELRTYKRRRTPTLLFASSHAGLIICCLLLFFEFTLNLSLSIGHNLLTEKGILKTGALFPNIHLYCR